MSKQFFEKKEVHKKLWKLLFHDCYQVNLNSPSYNLSSDITHVFSPFVVPGTYLGPWTITSFLLCAKSYANEQKCRQWRQHESSYTKTFSETNDVLNNIKPLSWGRRIIWWGERRILNSDQIVHSTQEEPIKTRNRFLIWVDHDKYVLSIKPCFWSIIEATEKFE